MQRVIAYLCASNAREAIVFYEAAFGAALEGEAWQDSTGRIGHAELRIGDEVFFLSDEHPELDVLCPTTRGGATSSMVLLVEDVDKVWERAIDLGATVERPLVEGNGLRSGWLRDPWGNRWNVGQPIS